MTLSLFTLFVITLTLLASVQSQDPTTVWGACSSFAVHAGTAVTFAGTCAIQTGDVGVALGSSITGVYTLGTGSEQLNSVGAVACASSKLTTFDPLTALVCPASN